MEFRITKGDRPRAFYLLALNLGLTLAIAILLLRFGEPFPTVDYFDLVFELASGCVSLLLFIAAAQVSVSGAKMNWLLLGLYMFQTGALIDALDEVVTLDFTYWSVAGDALRLAGEVILALVAFLFVRFTKTVTSTDNLTGLYNKTFHNYWIQEYLTKSSSRLAIIAIDLDKFKTINDVHGHDFGDMVLQHVGKLLKDFMLVRRGISSRTGGEEFEIALKRATEQSALDIAEQVRALIEQNPPEGLALTASIGVALSQSGEAAETLRKRADAAAYFSKQSGRNRVTFAGDNQTLSSLG